MSTNTNNSSKISGFYYDWQLSNPLLTATLHTNTYLSDVGGNALQPGENPYEKEGKFGWKLWTPIKDATDSSKDEPSKGRVHCLEPLTNGFSLAYDENPSGCYRAKPLITSILNEDFQVELGNAWSDNGGQTSLESAFNSLKSLAPYKKETGGAFKAIGESIQDLFGKQDGTGAANWIGKNLNSIGEAVGKGADSLNSALIQQGTRFSYYSGTSTNFGNLNMRFTLFADWIWDDDQKDWVFKTVHDQLREIYPYAVGKYYPLNLNLDQNVLKNNKELSNAIDKRLGEFFGWQQPPAGFQADMRSLDTCQQGTLRLVLGGYYTAENLLISGMSVNFSKTMTKIPPIKFNAGSGSTTEEYENLYADGVVISKEKTKEKSSSKRAIIDAGRKDGSGYLTPLYADVTITLRPASSYSDNTIINFSSNTGKGYFNLNMEKMRKDLIEEQKTQKTDKERNRILEDSNKRIEEDNNIFRPEEDYEEEPLPTSPPPSTKYHPAEQ